MKELKPLLKSEWVTCGFDGIYSGLSDRFPVSGQFDERELREQVAERHYDDYLAFISHHHSIPVMDYEVDRFLAKMPENAVILDIGGGWGWHWRRIGQIRPDVGVLIIDFVRANLVRTQKVLGPLVGSQVALMHADATNLPFPDVGIPFPDTDEIFSGFEGVWTVQTFQHIPDFEQAVREAHRVLKPAGLFINYSLHNTPLNRLIYLLLGKPFHSEGMIKSHYLARANDCQRQTVASIFGGGVKDVYTECLFHPDLKLVFSGYQGSWLGRLDKRLGNVSGLGRWIARQHGFEAVKT